MIREGSIVFVEWGDGTGGVCRVVPGHNGLLSGWWQVENLSDGFRSWHPPESIRLVPGDRRTA